MIDKSILPMPRLATTWPHLAGLVCSIAIVTGCSPLQEPDPQAVPPQYNDSSQREATSNRDEGYTPPDPKASPTPQLGRVKIDTSVFPHAVCKDQLPFFCYRAGSGSGKNKWFLHHQGGGGCDDEQGCLERWQETPSKIRARANTIRRPRPWAGFFHPTRTRIRTSTIGTMFSWSIAARTVGLAIEQSRLPKT